MYKVRLGVQANSKNSTNIISSSIMIKMLMFDLKESEIEFLNSYNSSDFDITFFRESLTPSTKLTLKECDETAILSVFITSKITGEVLDKFKNLRVIVTRSICYEHIDINACRERNIAVINATDYGVKSVSEYVLGLIFALTRNIVSASKNINKGLTKFEQYEGVTIDKLSIGIIGTGLIGTAVAELANKLGMKIYTNDLVVNKDITSFAEYVSFNDLLRKSDIVTIHMPYSNDYFHMIDYVELETMKEDSYLINVSKDKFINPISLYHAITNNKIKGCAMDIIMEQDETIFHNKNNRPNYEKLEEFVVNQKLINSEKVIITPRIAYNTRESLENILKSNFNDIKDFYIGRKTNRIL